MYNKKGNFIIESRDQYIIKYVMRQISTLIGLSEKDSRQSMAMYSLLANLDEVQRKIMPYYLKVIKGRGYTTARSKWRQKRISALWVDKRRIYKRGLEYIFKDV